MSEEAKIDSMNREMNIRDNNPHHVQNQSENCL